MRMLQEDFAGLAENGSRATCDKLINHSVAEFTASLVGAPASAGPRSLPTDKVAS